MEIFEQIKDMAKTATEKTEALAKSVGEKAEATMEIQKMKACIEKHEALIREHYAKIGEATYKQYVELGKTPENLADNFAVVAASMAAVDDLHKQIADIKVNKLGEDIPKTTLCLWHFISLRWLKPVTEEGKQGLAEFKKEKHL